MEDKVVLESVQEDIKSFSSLEAVKNSEGGKLLIDNLGKDVVSAVEDIIFGYKNLTIQEFMAIAAKLSERLSLLRTLTRSSENKHLAQEELKKLLEA